MTPLRTSLLLPLLALTLLTAPGCENPGRSTPPQVELPVGEWILTRIAGDGARVPADEGARPTLAIDGEGAVSGFSGVNRYTSSLSVEDLARGAFTLGPVATTRMAGLPQAMDLERRFLETLGRVDTFRADGDALVLEDAGEGLLHFLKTSR